MKKLLFLFLALMCVLSMGCTEEFDDTSIWQSIKSLEKRMDAADAVLAAYEKGLFITDVKEIEDGYLITFSDGSSASVYHGKDGVDGEDGEDGKDGKDGEDGINGKDGEDGKDGKDGEDGINGKDGKDGAAGDPLIEKIEIDDNGILFILADGTSFTIPYFSALDIIFDETDLGRLNGSEIRDIDYEVTSQLKEICVEVLSSDDIKARVIPDKDNALSGIIRIETSSSLNEYSKIVVLVTNGEKVVMKSLDFEFDQITITDNRVKDIDMEGGEVSLEFLTNVEYEVVMSSAVRSWISVVPETKTLESHVIKLMVQPNEGVARTGDVVIRSVTGTPSVSYKISQKGVDPNYVKSFRLVYDIDEPGETYLSYEKVCLESPGRIVKVDYGDGTSEETTNFYSHFYEHAGEYTVTVYYTGVPTEFYTNTNLFYGSPLKKIEFPASFSGYGFNCFFMGVPSLVEITFLGNVPKENEFSRCSNLQRFVSKYATEDGRAIIKDGVLIAFASGGYDKEEYVVPEGVHTIASQAFQNASVKKVILPSTLRTIGDWAFISSALEEIIIPEGVTSIADRAFEGTKLTKISLPESLSEIGSGIFAECDNLKEAEVACNIPAGLFDDCISLEKVSLKSGATEIGDYAFSGCASLKSIEIPSTVTSIGNYAFDNTSLESVEIGSGVTYLGAGCFQSCHSLTDVKFHPDIQLVSIHEYAFSGCFALETVCIPKTVENIFRRAFISCSSLRNVIFNEDSQLTYMDESVFANTAIEAIELPSGLTVIPDKAFYGCLLTEIDLPEGLESIGSQPFVGSRFNEIRIPDNVRTIGESAFASCYGDGGLSVYIGSGLEYMDPSALYHCKGLKHISSKSPHYVVTDDNLLLVQASDGCVVAYASEGGDKEYEVPETIGEVDVLAIGAYAFNSSVLETVTLPATIEHLGKLCLTNGHLNKVYFKGTVPPTMTITSNNYTDGGFSMIGGKSYPPIAVEVTKYVPETAVKAYMDAGYQNVLGYRYNE